MNSSIDFYNKNVKLLGNHFLEEIQNSIEIIQKNPDRYQIGKYGIRKYIIHRFPYNIYFRCEFQKIFIIAIAHHKRKPYYWKKRL